MGVTLIDENKNLRLFNFIFIWLLFFLALTVASSFIKMGLFNPIANFIFAGVKACLVIWFFMHVRQSSTKVIVFVLAGFIWLFILGSFVFSDFMTRGMTPVFGK